MGGPPCSVMASSAHPNVEPLKFLSTPEPVNGLPIGLAELVQPVGQRPADTLERRLRSQAMQYLYAESRQLREREAAKARLQQQQQQHHRQNNAIGSELESQAAVNGEGTSGVVNVHRGIPPSLADGPTPPQQHGGVAGEEFAFLRAPEALLRKKELRRTVMPKWAVNQLQAPDEPPPVFSVSRQRARSGENSLNSSVNLPQNTAAAAVAVEDPFEKSSHSGAPATSILAESKITLVSRNCTPLSSVEHRSPRHSASLQSSTSAWNLTKERLRGVAEAPLLVVGDVADVGAITAPMARRRREHRQQKAAMMEANARLAAYLVRPQRRSSPAEAYATEAVKGDEEMGRAAPSTPAAGAAAVLTTPGADAAPQPPTTTVRTCSNKKEEAKKVPRTYREKKHAADKCSVQSGLPNPQKTKAPAPSSGDSHLLKSVAAAIRDFFPADCSDYRSAIDAMPPQSCEELFSLYQAHQALCKRLRTSVTGAGLGPTLCEAMQTRAAAHRTPQQPLLPPPSPHPPPTLTATTSTPASPSPGKTSQRAAPPSRAVTLLPDAATPLLDDAPKAVKSVMDVGVTAASEPLSITPKVPPRAVGDTSTVVLASSVLTPSTRAVPVRAPTSAAATASSLKKRRTLSNFLSCAATSPTVKNGADSGEKPKRVPVAARVGCDREPIPRSPLLTSMEHVPHEDNTANVDDAMRPYEFWRQQENAKPQKQLSTARAEVVAPAASSSPRAKNPTSSGDTRGGSASRDSSLNFAGRACPSNRSLNSLRMNSSSKQSTSKPVLDFLHCTNAPATPPAETALLLPSLTPRKEKHGLQLEAQTSTTSSSLSPPSLMARRHTHNYLLCNGDDTSLSHGGSVSEGESVARRRPEKHAQRITVNTATRSSNDGTTKTTAAANHRVLPAISDTRGGADVAPPPLLPVLLSFSMASQSTLTTFSETSTANILTEHFDSSPTDSEAASVR